MSCVYCNIWFLAATFPNRWIGRDAPIPWPPPSPDINPLDFFLWGYIKDKLFSTPVPDITNLKAKITRFCYNNWRHVGEHVERNRLSIRRSPCNKRSTRWSVLMCCKKTSCVTFKKSLYSTYNSFLVINVCNQRRTLCSSCIIKLSVPTKRAAVILIKVKSCSSLLCVLQVCINIYLRSGLRYKFLFLDTCRRIHYLREQWCEDLWLFFDTKRGPQAKTFWKRCHGGSHQYFQYPLLGD